VPAISGTSSTAAATVRDFSDKDVPRQVIEDCIRTAGTAPSGANQQPWHFAVVTDPGIKRQIRQAAEQEEREFYDHRASAEWLAALEDLGTDADKPFLEIAPYLIVVFALVNRKSEAGQKVKHYYPYESVGLATGLLITALHNVGLASLTHTPNPMKFLNQVLGRPANERTLPDSGYRLPG
jgi:nitroreductase